MKTALTLAVSGLLATALPITAAANHDKTRFDRPLTVNILHMNDHHSHLKADDFGYDVTGLNLYSTRTDGSAIEEVAVTYGGFPM